MYNDVHSDKNNARISISEEISPQLYMCMIILLTVKTS